MKRREKSSVKELASDLEQYHVKINGIGGVTMKLIESYHLGYGGKVTPILGKLPFL